MSDKHHSEYSVHIYSNIRKVYRWKNQNPLFILDMLFFIKIIEFIKNKL